MLLRRTEANRERPGVEPSPAAVGDAVSVVAFRPTGLARAGLVSAAALAALVRFGVAASAAGGGDLDPLRASGFTVVFPLVLLSLLLALGPGPTREGVLMRLATAAQLVLVVAIPPLALHLLLGLPVAFLLVELFETRLPAPLRARTAAWFVR